MMLIHALVLTSLETNTRFFAKHVPGIYNVRADALSRIKLEKFRELAPEAKQEPEKLPGLLWPASTIWEQ